MLVIEYKTNGKNIVKIRKDWSPSRIGKAYTPPAQNNVQSKDAYRIQSAFIGKGKKHD
jgi:hypothetical protein